MRKDIQDKVLVLIGEGGKYIVNPAEGVVYWKKANGDIKELYSCRLSGGYKQINMKAGVNTYAHDVVWLSVHGPFKGRVRHKDGDKGNNKIDNLYLDIDVEVKEPVKVIRFEEIEAIKKFMAENPKMSGSAIARKLGLRVGAVCRTIRKLKEGVELKYETPGKKESNNAKYYRERKLSKI